MKEKKMTEEELIAAGEAFAEEMDVLLVETAKKLVLVAMKHDMSPTSLPLLADALGAGLVGVLKKGLGAASSIVDSALFEKLGGRSEETENKTKKEKPTWLN